MMGLIRQHLLDKLNKLVRSLGALAILAFRQGPLRPQFHPAHLAPCMSPFPGSGIQRVELLHAMALLVSAGHWVQASAGPGTPAGPLVKDGRGIPTKR